MADINGTFPTCADTTKSGRNPKRKKAKKLKRKLKEAKLELRFQKKISKERLKRCRAETELRFTKTLLEIQDNQSFYTLVRR